MIKLELKKNIINVYLVISILLLYFTFLSIMFSPLSLLTHILT